MKNLIKMKKALIINTLLILVGSFNPALLASSKLRDLGDLEKQVVFFECRGKTFKLVDVDEEENSQVIAEGVLHDHQYIIDSDVHESLIRTCKEYLKFYALAGSVDKIKIENGDEIISYNEFQRRLPDTPKSTSSSNKASSHISPLLTTTKVHFLSEQDKNTRRLIKENKDLHRRIAILTEEEQNTINKIHASYAPSWKNVIKNKVKIILYTAGIVGTTLLFTSDKPANKFITDALGHSYSLYSIINGFIISSIGNKSSSAPSIDSIENNT